MGFWDTARDVALTVGTGGVYGAYKAGNAATDGGVGRWLFGDNRARDAAMDPKNFQMEGANYLRDYASQQLNGAQGRGAPLLGQGQQVQLDPRQQAMARAQMQGLADQYQGVASGQQRGAGELAVGRQMQQAAAAQFAGANMARGSNAGIMARAASRQLGDMGTNAAGMASQSALQDQANARAGLGGLLSGMRGQDLDLASQDALLAQQRNLANQQSQLQTRGQNDQYGLGLMGQYANVSAEELRARAQRAAALAGNPDKGNFGQLLQIGGQAATMASDMRVKTEIRDASTEMDDAIASIAPYRYEYMDPAQHGEGSRVGVMAQDLASTAAGAPVVVDHGGVLKIDAGKALSFALAAIARLGARIEQLEAERGGG